MALGWITALKLVPWGDVIEATPKIVKGAKKLFRRSEDAVATPGAAPGRGVAADDLRSVAALTRVLEARVQTLEEEAHASAELIASLAEQNAEIIRVVDALRRQAGWLVRACAVSVVSVAALALWSVLR